MRKPRRFNLRPIYVDERKERLKAIEQKARRELGMEAQEHPSASERLHGVFTEKAVRRQRPKTGLLQPGIPMLVLLIVILVIIWRLLL